MTRVIPVHVSFIKIGTSLAYQHKVPVLPAINLIKIRCFIRSLSVLLVIYNDPIVYILYQDFLVMVIVYFLIVRMRKGDR